MLLVLARALFVGCALSGFGATLFALMTPVARRLDARQDVAIERHVREVMQWSLAAALVFGCVWLVLQTQSVAGTADLAQTLMAVPAVLFSTRFGQALALQAVTIAGALASAAAWRWPSRLAVALAGTAVLLEAGHSHAFAMAHVPLLVSQMLHLTAAGAWLGGLLPLLIVVRKAPLDLAQQAARRFSTLGTISVAVLTATALFQGTLLSGGLAGLTGTRYGAVLMIIGFWRRSAFIRWQALILIAITTVKVFVWDTHELDRIYRILSFVVLGVLLLAVSFAYQRDWLKLAPHKNSAAGDNTGA